MITKLKKLLKKTLIKIYVKDKNSCFLLENRLKIDKEDPVFCSSTFLIGSNVVQLNNNYCSENLGIKLPAILKTFRTFENLTSDLTQSKSRSGFSALILVKKDNLILKDQNYNFFVKSKEQKICMNIILLKNFAFFLAKHYKRQIQKIID